MDEQTAEDGLSQARRVFRQAADLVYERAIDVVSSARPNGSWSKLRQAIGAYEDAAERLDEAERADDEDRETWPTGATSAAPW